MRLDKFVIHKMGSIDHLEVDLSSFGDALLIAVTGPNGAGKTTALELAFPGALYRECPTRGSLQSLARARDSYVESRLVNGAAYTIRHSVDVVSGKGESLVRDADGQPVLKGTSVRAFDAWAGTHMPADRVLLSSIFAPQEKKGFIDYEPGDRKGVILRTLGIEYLETLAKRAREHESSVKAELETQRARIDDELKRGGDLVAIAREIEVLEASIVSTREAVGTARAALDAARAGAPGLELARLEAQQVREKRADIGTRIAAKRQELRPIEERIANNRKVLERAEEIRAAKTRSDELSRELEKLGEALRAAEERRNVAVRERDQHAATESAATKRAEASAARHLRAGERLTDKAKIDAAVARVPELEAALVLAEEEERVAAAELETLRGKRIAGADERIVGLRTVLVDIGDSDDLLNPADAGPRLESVARHARETVALDDAAAQTAVELPVLILAGEGLRSAKRDRIAVITRHLGDARVTAAGAAGLVEADRECAESALENKAAVQEAQNARYERHEADVRAKEADKVRLDVQGTQGRAHKELQTLAELVSQHEPLGRAEGRLAELEPQAVALRTEIAGLEKTLAETPEPPAVPAPPNVEDLERRVTAAEEASRGATDAVAKANDRLERAHESRRLVGELEDGRLRLDEELSDWTRLAAELGRDGLQAAEIDCAGPELTELTNDLLRTCVGPRWTVSIETSRPSSDGKKLIEDCEVRVLDTKEGREADAKTYSGGEKVLLREATSLALTMLGCRRSGIKGMTLVRDETGAALDPANARAYVAMLRRAAELVGASRVLFVSHSPEVIDLADARIEMGSSVAS